MQLIDKHVEDLLMVLMQPSDWFIEFHENSTKPDQFQISGVGGNKLGIDFIFSLM